MIFRLVDQDGNPVTFSLMTLNLKLIKKEFFRDDEGEEPHQKM